MAFFFTLGNRFFGCAAAAATVLSAVFGAAHAQSTSTVPGPVVTPGRSLGLAVSIAMNDGDAGYAQRIDYRQTVSDQLRLGALVFFDDRGGDYRFRRIELEGQYQFADIEGGWDSAIQVRGRIPDGNDGPGLVRVAWISSWRPEDKVELRLSGFASREFGTARRNGLVVETRAEASYAVAPDARVGIQIFNDYNTTADFGAFSTQRHLIGGVARGALTKRISYRANALHGLTEASPDFEFRLRLGLAL